MLCYYSVSIDTRIAIVRFPGQFWSPTSSWIGVLFVGYSRAYFSLANNLKWHLKFLKTYIIFLIEMCTHEHEMLKCLIISEYFV